MKKEDLNLVCPKCGKIIDDKDLKHWTCVECGTSFKVEFYENRKQKSPNNQTKITP